MEHTNELIEDCPLGYKNLKLAKVPGKTYCGGEHGCLADVAGNPDCYKIDCKYHFSTEIILESSKGLANAVDGFLEKMNKSIDKLSESCNRAAEKLEQSIKDVKL